MRHFSKPLVAIVATVASGLIGSCAVGTSLPGSGAPPVVTRRVMLMGDSLAMEGSVYFQWDVASHGSVKVETLTVGGAALCDLLPGLKGQLDSFKPDAVVLEFSGNALTPCMSDGSASGHLAGPARVDKYRADAASAMQIISAEHVVAWWATAPVNRDPATAATYRELNAVYQALPAAWPSARFVDSGSAVENNGAYAQYLPCLPDEPCTGPIIDGVPSTDVRAPDGGHLCPAAGVLHGGTCPVWSSGAYRYGRAMAAPVISYLAGLSPV